ncbi:heavy-metal-associated domain-containing protein [Flavobacterium sp. N2270]|uniref:heavy-metal-associated domain-containing protein n=1 Tax=Flavobacterium sp. N2270 TaxID=2986831 RepID=UPI0022258247|nr:heavy-metal-associated domain-containing protein [Flavobacterium sp. N2270]
MKTRIHIQNLKCGGCANTIIKNLTQLNAISNVEVDVEDSVVSFEMESEKDLEQVKTTLKKIGYPEDGEANSLGSKAKSYVSCAIGKITT